MKNNKSEFELAIEDRMKSTKYFRETMSEPYFPEPKYYKGVVYHYYSLDEKRYFYDHEYTNCYKHGLGRIAVRIVKNGEEYIEGYFDGESGDHNDFGLLGASHNKFHFTEIGYSNSHWVQHPEQNYVPKTVDRLRIDFPCVGKGALRKTPIRQREDAFNRGARFNVFMGDKMDTDVGDKFRGGAESHEGYDSWRPQRIKLNDYLKLQCMYKELEKFKSDMRDETLTYPNDMRYLNLDDGTSMTESEYQTIRKMVDSDYRTNDEILNDTTATDIDFL